MSTSKHPKTQTPTDSDLERNPMIGQSRGSTMARGDPDEVAGDSTVEGDVENETSAAGAADPAHRGRSNK